MNEIKMLLSGMINKDLFFLIEVYPQSGPDDWTMHYWLRETNNARIYTTEIYIHKTLSQKLSRIVKQLLE